MKKKVYIEVTEGHKFSDSVHNGCSFISVGFYANRYGQSSPCITDKEVDESIKRCKETILREGDIPVLKDERKKAKLTNWFGGE